MRRVESWLRAAGLWLKRVFWTRRAATLALVAVSCVLVVASAFAICLRQVALDTPTWVTASAEFLENDEIRSTVAEYLVDQLFESTDVAARFETVLPSGLQRLAGPVSGLVRREAVGVADAMLARPRVQALWVEANRVAHTQLVAAVEGDPEALSANGDVVLNLGPLVTELGDRIGLPSIVTRAASSRVGSIVIIPASKFEKAERAANALRIAAIWLGVAAFVSAVAAVWLARGRRRETVRALAVGALLAALVLFVLRRFIGNAVIDELIASESTRPAGLAAWYIATTALVQTAWVIFDLAIVGLLWSWFLGPMRWAVAARRWLAPRIGASIAVFYGVVAAIALILLAWGPLGSIHTFVGLVIVVALIVLAVESIRRQLRRELAAGGVPADPPA